MQITNREKSMFGKAIKSRDFGNFSLLESLYPSKAAMPRHTHTIAHISFVLQGSFTEICGRAERLSEVSTLIIHPPDEEHSVTFHDAGARIFSFHINPQLLERIRDFTEILDNPATFCGGQPAWLAAQLYRESSETDAVAPLMLEALAFEIIAATSRRADSLRERKIPKWLQQTQQYLHAYHADNISFSALAETVGVHPVRLAREFRREFRCTMGEYLRRLRIETACREVSGSDAPLNDIALKVGFYDQSHFTNVFKRLTGMTPAQYRATFRLR